MKNSLVRCSSLILAIAGFATFSAANAQEVNLRMRVLDAADNTQIQRYTSSGNVDTEGGEFKIQVLASQQVARVRMTSTNSDCAVAEQDDYTRTNDRKFRRAQFNISASNTVCDFLFVAWQENYQWAAQMEISVSFGDASGSIPDPEPEPEPPTVDRRFVITQGTERSSQMDTSSAVVDESSHGVRVYCGVSHFSYDDAVVHPNAPDAAHLHMFWGNTSSDAFSTGTSLINGGRSSCEGGTNNRSSYWMPALFDANNQVVLPESVISYYKSFASTPGFERSAIRPIPNGLQMLANPSINNGGPWNFAIDDNGEEGIFVRILFPNCLAVDNNAEPVLQSSNNVAHLSYADGSGSTPGDCPTSHPYRMPQLSYNVAFDVPFDSAWSLSSDQHGDHSGHNGGEKGASLHADYIAAWDETTMNRIVQCNRESRRECEFVSVENGQELYRSQLAERFLSPAANTIYSDSTTVAPGVDRTPFGTSLTKMR